MVGRKNENHLCAQRSMDTGIAGTGYKRDLPPTQRFLWRSFVITEHASLLLIIIKNRIEESARTLIVLDVDG